MTVAKYLRLSDADGNLKQDGKDESNSIGNQRNLLDTFISDKEDFIGANVVEFCDDGWSGKNLGRPAVTEMLAQVKAGKIQCIIVKDLSRFGRDYLTVGNYISKVFPFLGVRFIAVNDGIDTIDPHDIASLETSFKALLYDLYSRDLSQKIKSAKQFRAKRGDFMAPFAPYGYQKDPQNHSRLVTDPPAAETVRRIFRLIPEGHSAVQIAKILNSEGTPTPMLYKRAAGCSRSHWPSVREDNFWTEHAVTKILRDKRYLGTNIYGKRQRDIVGSTHSVKVDQADWVTVKGTHEGIVTQEEFDRAQTVLREFKERDGHTVSRPLAKKIRCGVCGHVLVRSKGKEKYYYCRTHQFLDGTGCIEVHIPENELLAALLACFCTYAALVVDQEKIQVGLRKAVQEEAKSIQKEMGALQKTQERYIWEIRELYEAFVLGHTPKSTYMAQKSTLTKRQKEANARLDHLQSQLSSLSADENLLAKFMAFGQTQEIVEDIVKDLLKEVQVFPHERIEIIWDLQNKFSDDSF